MSERVSKLDKMPKEEKQELVKRLHKAQDGLCFVDGKIIDLQVHPVDVDHIIALARGGADDESNWGLTHAGCNRSKGTRDLQLQRILSYFRDHVEKYTNTSSIGKNGNFTLNEALLELLPRRQDVGAKINTNKITISWLDDDKARTETFDILDDYGTPPAKSFVGLVPFTCLYHDGEINPRSIVDLEPMIEEFYNGYPQLQPSLGTLTIDQSGKSKIYLFDGQHKAAAQLYAGHDRLFVRVFVNCDKSKLKETNYRAHTKLAQIHFPQLINDRVGSDLFEEEYDRFLKNIDTTKSSELSFFKSVLAKSQRSEFKKYYENYLRYEVLTGKVEEENNQILSFTETVTARSKKFPLSYDTLRKTFFKHFLFVKAAYQPIEFTTHFRELEKRNLIRLMNIFIEEMLANNRFDLKLGIYRIEEQIESNSLSIPETHLRAYRLCRSSAMIIWTLELKRAIALLLNTLSKYQEGLWSEERPLWAQIDTKEWDKIRRMMRIVRDHKIWGERTNSEIVKAISTTRQKDWQSILLKGTLPGRHEQLLPPLDQNFIFQNAQGNI
jgi:hypothetical protein